LNSFSSSQIIKLACREISYCLDVCGNSRENMPEAGVICWRRE